MQVARADGKAKCNNCKCWRNPVDYVGVKGDIVKRCSKCREKDARQKKKPEVVKKRNELQREKQYYKAHRERKREEDEEAFLAHNAAIAREWRDQHTDHLAEWRTLNFRSRFGSLKHQAMKKGIPWDDLSMTDDVCKVMMEAPCFYCKTVMTNSLHGIDRADNNAPYIASNCVPCCRNCNFIKKSLDPTTFIERCQHIAYMHGGVGVTSPASWSANRCVSFRGYVARAKRKGLSFDLTRHDYNALVNGACFYCKRAADDLHVNGIDRMDNSAGYTLNNCVTCCSECNQMKAGMNNVDYVDHCKRVARVWHGKSGPFPDIPRCLRAITKRAIS